MSLGKRVLFSPVGTTDPVRGGFDGGMLHIVRHYKPNKVYLYYTEEMKKRDQDDNKCERAINYLDKDIDVVKIFGSIEPFDFDGFITEFNKILNSIVEENPEADILLNISSGTPQMKSTLCLEAVTSNKKLRPVQVTTPQKGANTDHPILTRYDYVEDLMMNNLDSLDESDNRCIDTPKIMSVRKTMMKSQIISLANMYDYEGALKFAQEYGNDNLLKLIAHGKNRIILNVSEAEKIIKGYHGIDLFPIKETKIRKLVEYLLTLKIKQKKNQITDMIIGLNPFIVQLLIDYCEIKLKVKVSNFIESKNRKIKTYYIDSSNLIKEQLNSVEESVIKRYLIERHDKSLVESLDKLFTGGLNDTSNLSIDLLLGIVLFYGNKENAKDIMFFEQLRSINVMLRNSSAHSLSPVYEKDIVNFGGMTSYKLIASLEKTVMRIYGNKINSSVFEIYEKLNEQIEKELNIYS